VIVYYSGTGSISVADSAGNTYTARNNVTSAFNQTMQAFTSLAIGSACTSVTCTATVSGFIGVWVWDLTATGTIQYADSGGTNYNFSNSSATDAVTTPSLNIGTSTDGLVMAASQDPGGGSMSIGTGFTSDGGYLAGVVGEHKAVSASVAGTFTDDTASSRPICMGLLLTVAASASAVSAGQWIRPLNPPGASPGKFGRFYQSPRSFAAPGVAVGLGGQGATFTAGSLTPSTSVAPTGQAATFATGALVPNLTVALTGQSAIFTAGTVTTGSDVTASLTGQAAAFTAGILAPSTTIALSGAAASFASGNLIATPQLGLTGASITSAAGQLSPATSVPLTGLSASFVAGIVAAVGDVTVALTGTSATFSAGQIQVGAGAQAGPVDSPRSAEGYYRRKRKQKLPELPPAVFISPASLEHAPPQAVIDAVPDFTHLAKTLGAEPAELSRRIDVEIARLMRAAEERDDEEALFVILSSLED
jgi:hypothetical protein